MAFQRVRTFIQAEKAGADVWARVSLQDGSAERPSARQSPLPMRLSRRKHAVCSWLEILHRVEIGNEAGPGGLPSELCLRFGA
jgi:hypothetical protein